MLSQQDLSAQDTFNKIYQLAKSYSLPKNKVKEKSELIKNELTRMVDEGKCLGIFQGEFNPIMLLAKEGESEAVAFLINEFKGSKVDALIGFAMGGHDDQVDQLITQGVGQAYAAFGYARGGYEGQVNKLIEQGANQTHVVAGYAAGGYVDHVNHLIEQAASEEDRAASRNVAVMYYARRKDEDQVNKLLAQGASRNQVLLGYAWGGHDDQVDQLLGQGASRVEAVKGYAWGGYDDQVNKLIAQGPEGERAAREQAVWAYAKIGHVDQVMKLINEEGVTRLKLNQAVLGYAEGGHVDQVNQLIGQGASDQKAAVEGYARGGYLNANNILQLMSDTGDRLLRSLLALRMAAKDEFKSMYSYYTHDVWKEAEALEKAAEKIIRNREIYHFNYDQATSLTAGTRDWLLLGPQIVRQGKIIEDIYWHITSMVLGLSEDTAKYVFNAVHDNLFQGIKHDLTTGFFTRGFHVLKSFFKSEEEIANEKAKLLDEPTKRYEERKKLH